MSSTQQLKSRIRSVKNTRQITKAMQMVAASKMRRTQEATKSSQAYTAAARELLTYLAQQGATDGHRWFMQRPVRTRLLIVVASDKGLAGAYNSNVIKAYLHELHQDDQSGVASKTIAVGRKAAQVVTRVKDAEIVGTYEDLPDRVPGAQFHAILNTAKDMFEDGTVDAVDVVFTRFVSSMTQRAETVRLFPAGFVADDEISGDIREAKFEPSPKHIIDDIAYRLIGARLYQTLLDSRASEHSMRMMAMKNATDNASDLVDDLTLEMNKERQGAITQELTEISAGVEAMK
jgi:ATP synthase F1, gamma subunit